MLLAWKPSAAVGRLAYREPTFEAQLEEDEFHMLWLVKRYGRSGKPQLRLLLSAALKYGLAHRGRVTRGAGAARARPC